MHNPNDWLPTQPVDLSLPPGGARVKNSCKYRFRYLTITRLLAKEANSGTKSDFSELDIHLLKK